MNQQDIIPVPEANLSDFAQQVISWHEQQVMTIQHFHEIPDGFELEIDGKPHTLTGDMLLGFKVGIQTCMNYLGKLPFVTYEE